MPDKNWLDVVSRGMTTFFVGMWGFLTFMFALLVVFSESAEPWASEIRLGLVLMGTMLIVIAASSATAWIHSRLSSDGDTGRVLRESVVRFSWLASPIAGGYGLSRLVESLAAILASTPTSP